MHFINKDRNRMDFSSVTDLMLKKMLQIFTGSRTVLIFLEWLMTTYQHPKDHVYMYLFLSPVNSFVSFLIDIKEILHY